MGMGAVLTLTGGSMINDALNMRKQAKASANQAEKTLDNMKTDTLARVAKQKASFIGSGIALDADTGVFNVLDNTLATGIEDMDLYRSNAKQNIKNIYSQGFSNMLRQGATMAATSGMSGQGGGVGNLFGGGSAASTSATTTSGTTGANSGFANLSNLFNFGG